MTENTDQTLVAVTVPRCMHCGNAAEVTMTRAQADALMERATRPSNAKIQHIFPDWSPDQRELLISGTHPECWTAMFGEDEDDEPAADGETVNYLLIPVDTETPASILEATEETSLAVLQAGTEARTVQCVQLAVDLDMWLDDEGKAVENPEHNERAQLLWNRVYGAGTDYIVGAVVLTGGADGEGRTLGLTVEQVTVIRRYFGEV